MFKNKIKENSGFTLLEIITVVIIISVLLLVAIPGVSRLLKSFREDYYVKLEDTLLASGKSYISSNRRKRPAGIFETTIIPNNLLVENKLVDPVVDYRKNACLEESYVIVVKTSDKEYSYASCLACPVDGYETDILKQPFCQEAWKTNDNISVELNLKENIYINKGSSLDKIREELGLKKSINKKDSEGNILASLPVDDKDVVYPTNLNQFTGAQAINGIAQYEYNGQSFQINVYIYENDAPKVTLTNIKDNSAYTSGTWSNGVRVVLAANDEYFGLLDLTIDEYQYYNPSTGKWQKIASCSSGLKSCTINYNATLNANYKYRLKTNVGGISKESSIYSFKVDNTNPSCNFAMIDGSGKAYNGTHINTNQVTVRYSGSDNDSGFDRAELYLIPNIPDMIDKPGTNSFTNRVLRTFSDEAETSLILKCFDKVGNTSTLNTTVKILRNITVRFYSPNSTTLHSTVTKQFQQAIGTLPSPTKTGYTLTGWYTASSGGTLVNSSYVISSTAKTQNLYARWKANNYTIAYNANGGSGSMSNTSCTYDSNCTLRTNTLTRTGHSFAGWATTSGGAVAYANGATVKNLTSTNGATVTLYAKWTKNTYTLTINPNGGQIHASSSTITNSNLYQDYSVFRKPTRTGYTFTSWSQSGTGTITPLGKHIPARTASELAGNSYWRDKIGVYNNAGDGTVTVTNRSGTNPYDNSGQFVRITSTGTSMRPGRGGFVFNTVSAANKVYYHVIVAKIPVGVTLTDARNSIGVGGSSTWLTSREGTGKMETYIYRVNAGSSGTFSSFGHVYASGTAATLTWDIYYSHMFDATSATLTNSEGFAFPHTGNKTVTANWSINTYSIAYNRNGGTAGSMSNTSCTYGSNCTLRSNAFTRTGYRFAGWATTSGGSVAYANGATVKNLTTTNGATVTLYAKWTANTYSIAYNRNGGSGTMSNTSCTYGVGCKLRSNTFSRTNYIFKGWATSTGGGVSYANGATVTNLVTSGTRTLYAVWAYDETKLVIYTDSAKGVKSCSSTSGTKINFYVTKSLNPSGWTTRTAYASYNGSIVAAQRTGEMPSVWYGAWVKGTVLTTGYGYTNTRYNEMYFKLEGRLGTTGANIVSASPWGGCT